MKSQANKFLTIRQGIALSDVTDEAIYRMDLFFCDYPAEVCSGIRTQEHQLELIRQACINRGIQKDHPSILTAKVSDKGSWLSAWSKLLVQGYMINPPAAERCQFDYTKPNGERRKAGNLIGVSQHQLGMAFDISSYSQKMKMTLNLNMIEGCIVVAKKKLLDSIVADYLVEPVNGAVHVDCLESKLISF